jgi:hypothetical protein
LNDGGGVNVVTIIPSSIKPEVDSRADSARESRGFDGPSLDRPGSGDAIELAGTGGLGYTPWLTAGDEACPYLFADGFERGTTSEWSLSVN